MTQYCVDIEIVEIVEPENYEVEDENSQKGYHLFIQIKLDDKPVELLIDTGASRSVFDPSLIGDHIAELTEQPITKSTSLNSEVEMSVGRINCINIGDFTLDDYVVGFTSLQHVNDLYEVIIQKEIVGLLGSDFLVQHNAVVNYADKKLYFSTNL